MIGAMKGGSVLLECYIEAYPSPFIDWIFNENKILVESDQQSSDDGGVQKYYKSEEILDSRLTHPISRRIMLNITNLQPNDFGLYKCMARNQLGRTYGIITLYGRTFLLAHLTDSYLSNLIFFYFFSNSIRIQC